MFLSTNTERAMCLVESLFSNVLSTRSSMLAKTDVGGRTKRLLLVGSFGTKYRFWLHSPLLSLLAQLVGQGLPKVASTAKYRLTEEI